MVNKTNDTYARCGFDNFQGREPIFASRAIHRSLVYTDVSRQYFKYIHIYIIKIKIHSSCEIEYFVETHLCKMCVILRSIYIYIYLYI